MKKSALLDDTGKYRYSLERFWGSDSDNMVNFILLNPSTADASSDDPTVRACITFAKSWGFDRLVMTNLFAIRETSPYKMKKCNLPLGLENDIYIEKIARSAKKSNISLG